MAFNSEIKGYMTFGKSFSRGGAFPLEAYEIWTDYDALVAYAANTDPAKDPSYIGQKVAYVDLENNKVIHYGIEIDGTLKELGAAPIGDDLSIEIVDGKIQIKGFGDHYYTWVASNVNPSKNYLTYDLSESESYGAIYVEDAVPGQFLEGLNNTWAIYIHEEGGDSYWRIATAEEIATIRKDSGYERVEGFISGLEPKVILNNEGQLELAWCQPSTDTIDGINSTITSLQNTVKTIENRVQGLQNDVRDVWGTLSPLASDVGSKEDVASETVDTLWANVNSLKAKDVDLEGRVAAIEGDYLVEADKTELAGATTAVSNRVTAIENDYLKAADKTELDGKITAAANRVGALETKVDTGDKTVSAYVAEKVAAAEIGKLTKVIVNSYEEITDPVENVIYMVPGTNETGDIYKEYMLIGGELVQTGDTTTDLSGYYTSSKVDELIAEVEGKIPTEVGVMSVGAGNGIEINGTASAPEIAIKLAETQGNVTLDIANGLHASIDLGDYAKSADVVSNATYNEKIGEIEQSLNNKLEANDLADYAKSADVASTYATKEELAPVTTTANNASTAVANLETRFDEIVAVGGEPNAINKIQVNGSELAITDKTVNIIVPTKFSDLTDDSGFDGRITNAQNRADEAYELANTANTQATQNKTNLATLQSNFDTIVTNSENGLVKKVADNASAITALQTHQTDYEAKVNTLETKTVPEAIARISANETALNTLNGTVGGHTTSIQKNADDIAALTGNVYTKDNVYTKTETDNLISALGIETVKADVATNKTGIANNKSAIEAEVERAKAAEQKNADAIALLIENPTDALDSVKELIDYVNAHGATVDGINGRLDDHDAILAGIGGTDEPATVIAAIQNAVNNLEPLAIATAEKLGGIKSAVDVANGDSTVAAVNAVYVDGNTGVASVKAVSTDTLTNGSIELVLFGGTAEVSAN